MAKRRYKITVAYDGTAYAGWQVQPNHVTVQGVLERILTEITAKKVKLHGSGRTDQGVHARGQVAHFDAVTGIPASKLPVVLNSMLPDDILVLSVRYVAPDFHARRDAVAKEYRYFIWNKPMMDPFERLHHTHIQRRIDIKAMRKAAKGLVGRHDFKSFCATSRRDVDSFVRNVVNVRISETDGVICISVKGQGFLYKMVRSMAGYLLRVGMGDIGADSVHDVLKARKRTAEVPTAPARGLFLWKVWY